MKENWLTKRLDDVCRVEYGTRVVQKKDGGTIYPVYGGGGATFFMDSYNRENCLVIARFAMSAKCTRFVKDKFFLNDSGLTICPKNDDEILMNFLNLQILYLNDHIYSLSRGTAQRNLDVPAFRNIEINYPKSLKEQQQIVAVLDEAFAAIDQAKSNIEKNIANAKELFQSKLNDVFTTNAKGWEQKRFQDIAIEFGRGKSKHRPRNDAKLFGGDYPFVQTGDVRNVEKFITKFSQTYNEIGLAQSKLWPKGTICITIAANIAETAILDIEACFPDSIIGLVVDDSKANRDYCFYALQYLKTELQAKGKGSAQDNINLGTFQTQFFPFPEINTQEKMVKILDDLKDKCILIEDAYKLKLENLEDLKKSIMQKVFSGELTNKSVIA